MEHHDAVHHYNRLSSPLHNLDARIKIIATLAYILVTVSTPPHHLLAFTIFAGLLLWSIAASAVPLRFILKRSLIVLPFAVLVAIGLPFMHNGATIDFAGVTLSITGLWLFLGASIKAFLSVASLTLLISTTPFNHLMSNLHALGFPALFIDMLGLTYRYIFVLTEEAGRLRLAAVARGFAPKYLPQSIIIGRLIGSLFVRSYERAERVYNAMTLRGFTGHMATQAPPHLSKSKKLYLLSALLNKS